MKAYQHIAIAALTFTPLLTKASDPTQRSFLQPNQGAFFEAGPAFSRWQGDGISGNLYGGLAALGVNAYESDIGYHQFAIQAGGLAGSYTDTATVGTTSASAKVDNLAVPILGNYNYVFKITDEFHAYLGVTAGVTYIDQSADQISISGLGTINGKLKATGFAPMAGINAGVSYDISKKVSVGIGYKFAHLFQYTRDISFSSGTAYVSDNDKTDGFNTHTVQATLSYRF